MGPFAKGLETYLWVVAQIWDTARAEDPFTSGERAHLSLVVAAPLGTAICLASGPRVCLAWLPQRSWFSPHWRGQIFDCRDSYRMPYLMLRLEELLNVQKTSLTTGSFTAGIKFCLWEHLFCKRHSVRFNSELNFSFGDESLYIDVESEWWKLKNNLNFSCFF